MTQIASSELLGADTEVLVPGDDGYAQTATTLFGDGTPDLVVRPRDAAGVAAALRYAGDAGLAVTVRSGGHSMAGLSTSPDGMIIDTRRISGVRVLDPASGRVRVGAGATWGAVAAALKPYGLGLTAGDTNQVGVGGLTLGGGIGWMVRRYGLVIDSLAAAQLVTADGRLVGADAVEHADLFWALRGGGGNFGVAVGFDFTAQPVTSVHFGAIGYQTCYQAGDLPRLIAGWRDLMRASDEKLTTTLSLMPAVAGQPASVTLSCCYASSAGGEAAEALRPFRTLAPVSSDSIRAMSYADVLEDVTGLPPGLRMEVRNVFFTALDDARVAAVDELFAGGGAALSLRSMGGAVARVSRDATAFAHRDAEVMVAAAFLVSGPTPPETLNRWSPVAALGSGAYVGFLGSADPADVAAAYPADTYRRLAEVKRRYDPRNTFRRTHNIVPGRPH